MKKFLSFALAAMMTVTCLSFVSCGDDDDDDNDAMTTLVGTQWGYNDTRSVEYEGMVFDVTVDMTINFKTTSEGEINMSAVANYMGQTIPMDEENMEFTYTYENGRGVMTDPEGEGDIPFTVSGNKLYMSEVDEETGEPVTIEFTRK